jgi:hypothetical protein
MSAQNPTPDDLRTIADNLKSEGQASRTEVLYNAADRMELLELGADKLAPAFAKLQADYLAAIKANVEVAKLNADLLEAVEAAKGALRAVVHDRPTAHSDEVWGMVLAALDKLEAKGA